MQIDNSFINKDLRQHRKKIGHLMCKNGDQFPCIEGLLVCHHLLNLVVLIPENVRSRETCFCISATDMFFTQITLLLPFTVE